jgi:adenylate cyclase
VHQRNNQPLRNKFTSFSFISLLFFGTIVLKAQDSKEILDLKKKLSLTKTDNEKVKIYSDLGNLYSDARNIDSAIHYSQISLPVYKKNNDVEQIGRANLFIGNMYLTRNDLGEGLKYLLEAEKYLHKTQNYEKRAMLNLLMARINTVYKKNDASAKYFNEILKYYHDKRVFDKRFVMYSYQGLYINYFVQQDFVKGFASLKTYIDFVEKYYPESLYLAYKDAGTFFLTSRDNKKSLYYFQKAYEVAKKNKDQAQIADSGVSLSMVYGETNQLDLAKKHLNDAKDYYESQNNKGGLASVFYYLSDTYSKEKDYIKAQEFASKCVKMSSESDQLYPYYKNHKGNIELKQIMEDSLGLKNNQSKLFELSKLVAEQRKSLNHFTEMNTVVSPELFIQNYEVLHRAYAFLGDYPQSYSYLKKMYDKKEETYGLNKMKEFSSLQSETEVANERAKVKLEEETKRIQLQKEIELKALRFEYEKKQAAAKTEEERKRLVLEEDLKRKEIQIKFEEEQKAIALKYNQEKNIAKINQEKKDAIAKADLESSKTQKNMWAIGAGLSLLLLGFAGFSYNQKRKDNKKIAEEKQKSDDLLLNILPYEVAEELKEKGKTNAKHFDEVSVLFTDFVNFTANSERIGVQEVLNELNICFTEFDRIMEKYNLEKIKTIGDAYLAVSGLPVSNEQHAKNAVNASLEILSYIQQRKKENPNALDIRIGIHSGPVIAGIVGVKKFAYDIWGDTVNTAARMEQNSSSGKVNVSEATYQLIKKDFAFEHRGKIETKGKGAMEMYFVNPT